MAKLWDDSMKMLVRANPQALVTLLLQRIDNHSGISATSGDSLVLRRESGFACCWQANPDSRLQRLERPQAVSQSEESSE